MASDRTGYWAHTPNDTGEPHSLKAHLTATSDRAAMFGEEIGCPDLTGLLGLWHGLGKATEDFQRYLHALDEGRSATS